jgi:pimeloyl-ACP methyl ester carboxylesterase
LLNLAPCAMPAITCPSGTLFFVDEGTGDPVLLLHAGCGSSAQWTELVELLRPSQRVLALDFHGCGRTSPWTGGPNGLIAGEVELVRRLLDRLGDARAHLVGHSYGGWMGLHAALALRTRLASLALIEPVAVGMLRGRDDAACANADSLSDAIIDDVERGNPEPAAERFVDYWNWAGCWKKMPPAFRNAMVALAEHIRVMHLAGRDDTLSFDDVRALSLPTLLLHGEVSPMPTRSLVRHLAMELPRARSIAIPAAGHMSPLTHSALVGRALMDHFAAPT